MRGKEIETAKIIVVNFFEKQTNERTNSLFRFDGIEIDLPDGINVKDEDDDDDLGEELANDENKWNDLALQEFQE